MMNVNSEITVSLTDKDKEILIKAIDWSKADWSKAWIDEKENADD